MRFVRDLEKKSCEKPSHKSDSAAPLRDDRGSLPELQRHAGNQAVQQFFRSGIIQAKLAISNPGNPEEREADQVANSIMRAHAGSPISSACSCAEGGEMCEECQQKQARPEIHRHAATPGAPAHVPDMVSDVLRSPGQPLDAGMRAFFEPRFGRDFGEVLVHSDSQAARSASAVNAFAFTFGQHIVFGEGTYSPDTLAGRRLLAHELTHTVQQGGGTAASQGSVSAGMLSSQTQAEADTESHATRIASGEGKRVNVSTPLQIARDEDPRSYCTTLRKTIMKQAILKKAP